MLIHNILVQLKHNGQILAAVPSVIPGKLFISVSPAVVYQKLRTILFTSLMGFYTVDWKHIQYIICEQLDIIG